MATTTAAIVAAEVGGGGGCGGAHETLPPFSFFAIGLPLSFASFLFSSCFAIRPPNL